MLKVSLPKSALSIAVLLTVSSLTMVGCDKKPTDPTSSTASTSATTASAIAQPAVQNQGQTYTVAMDATYPPYEFKGEKGEVIGFDADILRAIGEKQGFNVNLLPKNFEGLEEGLKSNQYDLVMSAMTRSDERAANYELSDTYAYGRDAIMTKANVTDINTFEDLKNRKVATQIETGSADDLIALQGKGNPNTILEKTNFLAFQDVIQGKADAVLSDEGVLRYHAKSYPNEKTRFSGEGDYFKPFELVLMAKKGNLDITNKFNVGLKQIVADGTYTKIYKNWFGVEPTAEQLPHGSLTPTASTSVPTAK